MNPMLFNVWNGGQFPYADQWFNKTDAMRHNLKDQVINEKRNQQE